MPLSVMRNASVVAIGFQRDMNLARRFVALGMARGNALAGILQHIGQRLGDQPSVAFEMHRLLGRMGVEGDFRMARRAAGTPPAATVPAAFSRRITGVGMRAKDENSSTMRPISPTWRMMVSMHWRKISGSVVTSPIYLRFSRSAESWMGVSGFLISWAMRRATSAQAAVRCAETRSVMSSKVTTKPWLRRARWRPAR